MKSQKINISLESLLDFSAKLNENLEETFILNSALLSMMGKLKIFRACVFIPDFEENVFKVLICKGSRKNLGTIPMFPLINLRNLNIKDEKERRLCEIGYETCIPIIYQEVLLAIICLGKRADSTKLSIDEQHYAWLISVITANALQNAKYHKNLIEAKNNLEIQNQLLTTLFEMSREFSSFLSKEEILKSLSYRLMGQLTVTRFAVYLLDNDNKYELIINRFDKDFHFCHFDELTDVSNTIFIEQLPQDSKSKEFLCSKSVEIICPMFVQSSIKGYLLLGRKLNKEPFSNENLLFIEALGNIAIVAIENNRLFDEEIEKKRLENELGLALEIQKNLLPKQIPNIPNFDLSGISVPSRHVGGDYYDFIQLPDNQIFITIADVSGKGMPASLLMANVQAALRILAPLMLPLKQLIERLNKIVYQNTSPEKFVTLFCGVLNYEKREFKYLNAGHNPPIHFKSNNRQKLLTEGGLILGFSEDKFPYTEGEALLEQNDIIILYTDGITEASNEIRQEYGEEKLVEAITKTKNYSASQIQSYIFEDVKEFSSHAPQSDDITLVVLKAL